MDSVTIKVDGIDYDVPSKVAQRMGEYYRSMNRAVDEYNKLMNLAKNTRSALRNYFTSRNSIDLRMSKAKEKELDDYLAGKQAKNDQQLELYR